MTTGKVSLRFDMSKPEDREEYYACFNGPNYKRIIDEFYEYIRQESKYNNKDSLTIEEIREKLNELRKEHLENE